jgi:hypothetical protein
VKKFVNRCKIC